MKRSMIVAVSTGAVVGAACGLVEAVVCLAGATRWQQDAPLIAVSMALYAAVGVLAMSLWALLARSLPPRVLQHRARWASLLVMAYVFGGATALKLWFPLLKSAPALLFLGVWTIAAVILAIRLATVPGKSSTPASNEGPSMRGLGMALLGLTIIAGLSWLPPHLAHRAMSAAQNAPVAGHPNVVMIVMDTTRADRLSCYGYSRPTTPNVDRLAAEGTLFERAMASAPWTMPSHATLFTGLYTAQHRAERSHRRLDDQLTTLAEVLRERGYQTAGFSNNAWVSHATNFAQGFECFDDSKGAPRAVQLADRLLAMQTVRRVWKTDELHGDNPGGAGRINGQIRRWFDAQRDPERPLFLFINYLDAHNPYLPLEPYRSKFLQPPHAVIASRLFKRSVQEDLDLTAPPIRFDAQTWGALSDLYDGEVAYVDAMIGQLLEDVRRRQGLDDTVVVIVSDHGEHLGEHQFFEHRFSVYEEVLHVPLIFWSPTRIPAGVRIAEPVSLADVFPTMLRLVGVDQPALVAGLPGHALIGSPSSVPLDRPMLAEYEGPSDLLLRFKNWKPQPIDARYFNRNLKTLRQGAWKFIWASDGQRELYDLSRDPQEAHDLSAEDAARAAAMEQQLQTLLGSLKPLAPAESVPEMDPSTRQQLRSLGYVQ